MRIFYPALVLVAAAAAAGAASSGERSMYVTWSSRSDNPATKGEAATAANTLGQMLAGSFDRRFPCGSSATQDEIAALLDYQRKLDLLGQEVTPETLANIAGSLGARYVVSVTVTQTGSTFNISTFAMDSTTAKVVHRGTAAVKADGSAFAALQAFADSFVNGMAAGVPRCAGKDWAGVVTIAYEAKRSGGDISENGSGTLSCRLYGDGGRARCSYTSNYSLKGPGGTVTTMKGAKDAEVGATASVNGGKLHISIGVVRVTTKMTGPGVEVPPFEENLSSDSYDVPATDNPTQQSGSFSPPAIGHMKVTVNWSLSRPAPSRP
ncbi:MAG: hypothetical protein HY821_07955 [Acidobacteria bacterium]|nr:hypothetical protein [Acidobacteriota bacterium]